jgi:hypothetical protein
MGRWPGRRVSTSPGAPTTARAAAAPGIIRAFALLTACPIAGLRIGEAVRLPHHLDGLERRVGSWLPQGESLRQIPLVHS